MTFNDMVEDPMDRAIARRLASLAQTPIDTERLDRAMCQIIPNDRTCFWRQWLRLLLPATVGLLVSTVAFGSLLLVIISAARLLPSRQIFLSPSEIAEIHGDMVAETIPTYQVKSIEEANRAIAAMAGDVPPLPDLPAAQAIKCCLKTINGKPLACILLEVNGLQVTLMVVADSAVALSQGAIVEHNGRRYHIQSVGKLNIVMTEESGRWVCLVAEAATNKLMEIAAQLRF